LTNAKTIFNAYHSKPSKVVPLAGAAEPTKNNRQFFEKAIKDAEDTEEFDIFAKALVAGPLSSYLERLTRKEEKRRKKSEKKRQAKPRNLDKVRKDTAYQAARAFFRNTGVYLKLWQGADLQEFDLLSILKNYGQKGTSVNGVRQL